MPFSLSGCNFKLSNQKFQLILQELTKKTWGYVAIKRLKILLAFQPCIIVQTFFTWHTRNALKPKLDHTCSECKYFVEAHKSETQRKKTGQTNLRWPKCCSFIV